MAATSPLRSGQSMSNMAVGMVLSFCLIEVNCNILENRLITLSTLHRLGQGAELMAENTISEMREKLRQTQSELLQLLDECDLDALRQPRDEEKWTLLVILAHLAEA